MFRQFLILIGAVLLSGSMGFVIPFVMADQAPTLQVDEDALREQFKLELAESMERQLLAEEEALRVELEEQWEAFVEANPTLIQEYLDNLNEVDQGNSDSMNYGILEDIEENVIAKKTGPDPVTSPSENVTDTSEIESSETALVNTTLEDTEVIVDNEVPLAAADMPVTASYVKDAWINQQIALHRAKIADDDLAVGSEIYNRLDTTYLFGLARDGLTTEEEKEAKAYLRANLNDAELFIAEELYNKYVYLLD